MGACWAIGDRRLFVESRQVLEGDCEVGRLRPQELKLLLYLLEHQGEVATSTALQRLLWAGHESGNEHSLESVISELRKVVGKEAIKNIYGTGYQLQLSAKRIDPAFIVAGRPHPVQVRWDPAKGESGGIWAGVDATGGRFIPFAELKLEAESNLLPQVGNIPEGSFIEVADWGGNKNWVVHMVSPEGVHLGDVWLGSNPYENWASDGLVHVGEAPGNRPVKVWQVFQRYSDGSYRCTQAQD